MNKRITLVSIFDKNSILEIKNKLSIINNKLCKVPFGRVINREEVDTLPYHFTLSAWDISLKNKIISTLNNIEIKSFQVKVNDIKVMNGTENSYILYFEIEENEYLKELQKKIYIINPVDKYNPDYFKFHITIHIDKDYDKIIKMQELLKNNFKEFYLNVENIGLYEIYPAGLVMKIKES